MALKLGELVTFLRGDTTHLDASLRRAEGDVQSSAKRMSMSMDDIATAATAAWAAIGATQQIYSAVTAAGDLEQAVGKAQVVLGSAAAEVEAFAATAAETIGQSKRQALDAASGFAIYGKTAGLAGADLADFSITLTRLASDMASFSNARPEEAIDAIGAALRGESDPIERFGVLLNEATIQNRAFQMGLIATEKEALTPQQRVLAAYAEILAQTGDAQGDFARTSDSLANRQATLSAKWEDAKATLASSLLPAASSLVGVLGEMASFLADNHEWVVPLVAVLGGMAGIIMGIVLAYKAWTIAQIALNIAMSANPIGLIILAVVALIAIIWVLVANWDKVWSGIKDGALAIGRWFRDVFWGQWIKGAWDAILGAGEKVVTWFRELPRRIADHVRGMWDSLVAAFKGAINHIISIWNNFSLTIGGGEILGVSIPSITLHTPDIPYLARGGIVPATPGGRLIVAGEGGRDEIVAPEPTLEALTRRAVADAMRELGDLSVGEVCVHVYLDGEPVRSIARAEVVRAGQRSADWARAARPSRRR